MQAIIDLAATAPVLPDFPSYGICILESRHSGQFQMTPSRYDFLEVMLVLNGEGWVVEGGTRHPLKAQDLIVVPAGHCYHLEDRRGVPLAILCLCVRPSGDRSELWKSAAPDQFLVHRNAQLSREIASHLRAILFEQSQPTLCVEAAVTAHSLLLLARLRRKSATPRTLKARTDVELLARVQDYVNQLERSFHESETLENVASRLGLSARSLTSYFRSVTGQSRQQYIQGLRLRHACRLLRETDQSVTSIAFACGFEDVSTFFRAFRTALKMSPSQWRERAETDLPNSPCRDSQNATTRHPAL
jgi:AraC-like DNA-binding protein/mannose-6-phosphate isomerase-like protein (cupin superfamily)